MPIMKILVDGHEFHARINSDTATPEQISDWADSFRSTLTNLASLSIKLTDGSFLILGKKSLERALFVFVAKNED